MAKLHCRYCGDVKTDHDTGAGFATLTAYDAHLILYKDVENEPWNGYNGRPVCVGQRDGRAYVDPNLTRLREQWAAQPQRDRKRRSSLV